MQTYTVILNYSRGSYKSDVEAPDALAACEAIEARFRSSFADIGARYRGGLDIRVAAIDGTLTHEEALRRERSAK